MALKDVGEVKQNAQKTFTGAKGLLKAAFATAILAIPVHDIWTGDSLISKTWNSIVVSNVEDTSLCEENAMLEDSFVCQKRGDGKDLSTLVPEVLK